MLAEELNGLLKQAVELKKSSEFRLGVEMAVLQFADDTIFIHDASL